MDLDEHPESGLQMMLTSQKKESNAEFKICCKNYKNWIASKENRPTLSVDILDKFILPKIKETKRWFYSCGLHEIGSMVGNGKIISEKFLIQKIIIILSYQQQHRTHATQFSVDYFHLI